LLEQILNGVASLGFFAPVEFIPIYMIGTALFVPTAVLTLAAGALFGVPVGFVVALIASLSASSGGFLAGRYLSRGWILEKIASNEKIRAIDDAVSRKGWKLVLFLRFSAIVPFTILNYGLGLSNISFKDYFSASLIGSVPGTLLYVYLGSLAGKLVFEGNPMQKTPVEMVFISFGFIATIVMGIYSTAIVKKALRTS
jgi:uncharacterized membrane protein YdjX (TVP38/TMEM64 family)